MSILINRLMNEGLGISYYKSLQDLTKDKMTVDEFDYYDTHIDAFNKVFKKFLNGNKNDIQVINDWNASKLSNMLLQSVAKDHNKIKKLSGKTTYDTYVGYEINRIPVILIHNDLGYSLLYNRYDEDKLINSYK